MNKHEKFLKFNGKNIVFLSIDGTYWIAIKPICDALNIDADRSIKNSLIILIKNLLSNLNCSIV